MREQIHTFDTTLGWMALLGNGVVLRGLAFGHDLAENAATAVDRFSIGETKRAAWQPELAVRLARLAAGETQDFSDVRLDVDDLSPFSRRVLKACRAIPWGRTATYGELAQRCGSPNAARAVGNIMARNRFPLIVPCHRVLPISGGLGGFSSPHGTSMKERLLALEQAQLFPLTPAFYRGTCDSLAKMASSRFS